MEDEIKFFLELFPDLDEEEIEELLEAVGLDIKAESSTNYSDFINDEEPDSMSKIKNNVLSKLNTKKAIDIDD